MNLSPRKIVLFIAEDVWRIRLRGLPKTKSFLIRNLRIVLVALKGFNEDKCQLRASALTFYTLLSIVPIVAMAFGVAKGFGFEKMLEHKLLEGAAGQTEVLRQVIAFARNLLDNTKGGLVAGIGVAILFWTVIKVLSNIEVSFNDIWGIKSPRSLGRKFSDYISIMLTCPILFIIASSLTIFIASHVKSATSSVPLLSTLGPGILFLLKGLPYCIIWALFTFIYIVMPNTRVNFRAGLLGGIAAGTIYLATQWVYIRFQIGVANYNAIYGSFAALPLFLVWLQLSWLIVLFGAEISFAQQNVDTYEFEPDTAKVSHRFKLLVAALVTRHIVRRFARGEAAPTEQAMSHDLDLPIRLLRQVLYELVESGVLVPTGAGEGAPAAYQPARDIRRITVAHLISALDHRGVDNLELAPGRDFLAVQERVRRLDEALARSPENLPLGDLE